MRAPGSRGHPHVPQNFQSGSIMALHSAHGTGTSGLPQCGQNRTARSVGSGVRQAGHAARLAGAGCVSATGAGASESAGAGRSAGAAGATTVEISGAYGLRYTPTPE